MTALIPALINLAISGIRRGGGGGGGGGGRPPMSDAEKDDEFWRKKTMSIDLDDFAKQLERISGAGKSSGGEGNTFDRYYKSYMQGINPPHKSSN